MKKILMVCSLLVLVMSCKKDDPTLSFTPQGTYTGTFLRNTSDHKYDLSDVTITFTDNKYSGSAATGNYPEICSGTFQIIGSQIEFTNGCMFVANFDWTLIIGGRWDASGNEKSFTMTKKWGEGSVDYDIYTLTKKVESQVD